MWLSVFIVFSLFAFVWFSSFQERIVALLNTPEGQEETVPQEDSPFAIVQKGIGTVRGAVAQVGSLFQFLRPDVDVAEIESEFRESQKIESPKILPLAENK